MNNGISWTQCRAVSSDGHGFCGYQEGHEGPHAFVSTRVSGPISGVSGSQCSAKSQDGVCVCVAPEGHEGPHIWLSGRVQLPKSVDMNALHERLAKALEDMSLDDYYEPFFFDALSALFRAIGRMKSAHIAERFKAHGCLGYDEGYRKGRKDGYDDGYDQGYDAGCDAEE